MLTKSLLPLAFFTAAVWAGPSALAQPVAAPSQATEETAAAAEQLLSALDESQRDKLVFDFDDADQRKRWSNLPVSMFERRGLRMGDLTQTQRDAAMAVLEAALSPQGYEKIVRIVESDEVLKNEGGGRGPAFGRDEYFISFLGQPSADDPWTIQFGGHHLGINITLAGEHGTLAPSHTGAQPATYEIEGKTVRPLGREVDKAFALLSSLDDAQRKKAILGFEMRDLVLGPGRDGQMIQPEGIQGADLTQLQRAMLLDVASEWTGIMHEEAAAAKLEEISEHIADTWFAWSGPVEQGGAAYFRIQGPTVFIEFAPQRLGGDATNHIHTIYRDPTNEYGKTWWKP